MGDSGLSSNPAVLKGTDFEIPSPSPFFSIRRAHPCDLLDLTSLPGAVSLADEPWWAKPGLDADNAYWQSWINMAASAGRIPGFVSQGVRTRNVDHVNSQRVKLPARQPPRGRAAPADQTQRRVVPPGNHLLRPLGPRLPLP